METVEVDIRVDGTVIGTAKLAPSFTPYYMSELSFYWCGMKGEYQASLAVRRRATRDEVQAEENRMKNGGRALCCDG